MLLPLHDVVGPVLVKGESARVLSVGVAPPCRHRVRELVQLPVLLQNATAQGVRELQVRFAPSNGAQLMFEEEDTVPKVPVLKRPEWDTLQ